MIDSHCHLVAPEFALDRMQVLERARAAGVQAFIAPAVEVAEFPLLADLCRTQPDVFAAYGLHPMYLAQHQREHVQRVQDALSYGVNGVRAVAVGESGLDYFLPDLDAVLQLFYFEAQLKLARDFDLPIILHARRAHDAVAHALKRFSLGRAVVHSFAGSEAQALTLFRQGVMIGIGGPITYPRAQRLRRIVASMPLEFLLLETDAPDQPLIGQQGMRNEPAQLAHIASCIAELRGCSTAEVIAASSANARRLFQLPHPEQHTVNAA